MRCSWQGNTPCTVSQTAMCDRSWAHHLSPRTRPRQATEPGHLVVPPAPCARPHRQNPTLASLAGFPGRSTDHVHRNQAQGGRLPRTLRRCRLRSSQHLREKRRIYEGKIYALRTSCGWHADRQGEGGAQRRAEATERWRPCAELEMTLGTSCWNGRTARKEDQAQASGCRIPACEPA